MPAEQDQVLPAFVRVRGKTGLSVTDTRRVF